MSFSDTLTQIYSEISSRSAAIDEKISRLQRAKQDIAEEQRASLEELPTILKPALDASWKGSRATSFDQSRENAHKEIVDITNGDYDSYKESIQEKIDALQLQQSALDIASGLAILKKQDEAIVK